MKTVLVTGYKGFVGRHFCRKFESLGWNVSGIDVADGTDVRDFFKTDETKFDLVVHLAAVVGGRRTIEGSPLSVAVDLSIDAEMANWATRTKPGRIVYFSSSAAYPVKYQTNGIELALSEDMLDLSNVSNPDLTYGWAKLTGEYLMQFLEAEGIPVNVFRPFSGYGTDQALDYPFPSYIKRGLEKADPFEIWGDGQQVRDFIHITDIVDAVIAATELDVRGPVNLGWGRATTFNELAEIVTKQVGYSPKFQHVGDAPIGVTYRVSNPLKMMSFYTPKISLEEGVSLALQGIV